ncbi:hypothetical protein YC2023_117169 [Brassica napus]
MAKSFGLPRKCFYRGRKFRRRTNLQVSATSSDAEDLLFFRMPRFVLEMFAGLKMFRDVARDDCMDVRSQNCCSCLDLICDRGVRTKGSRKFVPGKRHPHIPCFVWCWPSEISLTNSGLPFSRQVIGEVVAQLFWLCMKAVPSFIAKDVVAKRLDHDPFVLSIRSSRLESFLKGML